MAVQFPDHHDAIRIAELDFLSKVFPLGQLEVLFIGGEPLDLGVREARVGGLAPGIVVPSGTWVFRLAQQWRVLVVDAGSGGQAWSGSQSELRPPDENWCALVTANMSWAAALPAENTAPRFALGTLVTLVGGDGTIGSVFAHAIWSSGEWQYQVAFGKDIQRARESNLSFVNADSNDPQAWIRTPAATSSEIGQELTLTKLRNPLSDVLYSYGSTRTVFRPYQFKPLLKLLNSARNRLLIADEVGLGKTIEAGLIWAELDQRSTIRRGLVVCPASLTRKWQTEMRRRFDRDLEIIDKNRLLNFVTQLEEGRDPQLLGIVSLESLRVSDLLDRLRDQEPQFDLIIVDEAHYLRNTGTKSFDLAELLGDWSDVLLFLSATPLNLGNADLFNLLSLLDPDTFPDVAVFEQQVAPNRVVNEAVRLLRTPTVDAAAVGVCLDGLTSSVFGAGLTLRPEYLRVRQLLRADNGLTVETRAECQRLLFDLNVLSTIITRTRKADVPDAKATRVAQTIEVAWTNEEADLYMAVRRWAELKALIDNGVVGFATIMPLRQAASCLPAMRARLTEGIIDGIMSDEGDFDDHEFEAPATAPTIESRSLHEAIWQVKQAAAALGTIDTKFDRFADKLRQLRDGGFQQAMVFSFFRRTLSYLHDRLADEWTVRVMDGSVSMDDRARIMQEFRDGKFDVLLLSEVGAEGLDFEFCGVIVNYDLPWNPMRVEQRIGRIDRLGQRFERIQIVNFHVPGTIESDILDRLYRRIRVFEESIGELEPILRDELTELTRLAVDPSRTIEERQLEMDRRAVALEHRGKDLAKLSEASSGLLTGIDQLLIDGLERDTVANGRYVGGSEIRRLLDSFVESAGARLRPPAKGKQTWELIGNEEFAARLIRHAERADRVNSFIPRLRDGEPIYLTFDADVARTSSMEFMSLQHPIVRAATRYLDGQEPSVHRYGGVTVKGAQPGEYLVLFALINATGLRPTTELRSVALSLDGQRNDSVGDLVLGALAAGTLEDSSGSQMPGEMLVTELCVAVDLVRDQLETGRRADNDAIVAGQSLALQSTYRSKIARSQRTESHWL